MQIKEVKIASFQTNEKKICLLYQYRDTNRRYLIRINRKIVKQYITIDLWDEYIHNEAMNDMIGYIYAACNQTKLNI